ncbi:MAG: hypothetical protein NVS2B5_14210 [Beijerinckiaceae bacterium]
MSQQVKIAASRLAWTPRRGAAEDNMNFGNLLHWAVVFLVIAIIAAVLGFGGVAGTAMEGAKILFWVALVLLLISLVFGFARRGRY